jgi:FtsP/CotA-like multicopper oxidase with cupredoxin domain
MDLSRRDFLVAGAGVAAPLAAACDRIQRLPTTPADHTLRIATGLIEIAPNRTISTTLYNNQFPGPLLRLREGRPVTIDIFNDTARPEQLHWHGQLVGVDVDGAAEEGTPYIPAHGHRRITFTPGPAGLRFYHTHAMAGADLTAGLYSGQVGVVYIEPSSAPGAYDQELFLVLKEFGPSLTRNGAMEEHFLVPTDRNGALEASGESARLASVRSGVRPGFEVEYRDLTINGRTLGFGEPIRVKRGDRLLLHVVNASATAIRSLALPGHTFHVFALDGNRVPTAVDVDVLWLAPGERISAFVTMDHPGVWILGDIGEDRFLGMGTIVEYAGATGGGQWLAPSAITWDYSRFGEPAGVVPPPDHTIDMLFTEEHAAVNGFNRWLINGVAFVMGTQPIARIRKGQRCRLRMRNASDDIHPIHLHRHIFELTKVAGRPTAGIYKDVVMIGSYQELEVDFTANSPGLSLFHCHMQTHMDFGFMSLIDCR